MATNHQIDSDSHLLVCVLCTRPLTVHHRKVDIFHTPSCKHVFCSDCKTDYINCVNPYFLESSLQKVGVYDKDSTSNTHRDGILREISFRCPVCKTVFKTETCTALALALGAKPVFTKDWSKDSPLHKQIFNGNLGLHRVNGTNAGRVTDLYCKKLTHKGPIPYYCDTCQIPMCEKVAKTHRKENSHHSIRSLDAKRRDCLSNIDSIEQHLRDYVGEQTRHKRYLRLLKEEQESLHRRSKLEVERRVANLIDHIKNVQDVLINQLKTHREDQTRCYEKAMDLCDYSLNRASKLSKLCQDLTEKHQEQSSHAKLVINFDTIKESTESLEVYRQACENNVERLRHFLNFHPGENQNKSGKSNTVNVGVLSDTTMPLPNLDLADNKREENAINGGDRMREVPPERSLSEMQLKPCPTLLWKHTIASGAEVVLSGDGGEENPNLAGALFLSDDRLLVAEYTGIQIYDQYGNPAGRFQEPPKSLNTYPPLDGNPDQAPTLWPQAIAQLNDDHVIFTDRHKMTMYVYTNDGEYVSKMRDEIFRQQDQLPMGTEYGSARDRQMYLASAVEGLLVLPNGKLAVADAIQHCVHILDPHTQQIELRFGNRSISVATGNSFIPAANGSVNRMTGNEEDAILYKPSFLALRHDGKSILVADSGNSYIKMYSLNGKYIGRFNGNHPSNHPFPGLEQPGAILVNPSNGVLVVANNNPSHGLVHFTKKGQYLGTLPVKDERGKRISAIPYGLALGSQGQLAMTHKHEGCVNVVQLYE